MNEIVGVAVYLILALPSRLAQSRLGGAAWKKSNRVTAPTRSSPVAATGNIKRAQRQDLGANHEHALPWVIPTALAPAGTCVETKKAATPSIQSPKGWRSLSRGLIELSGTSEERSGQSPSTPPGRPANHPPSTRSPAIATPSRAR